MKWVLASQSTEHHRWVLRNAEASAAFTYNLPHRSIRLKATDNRLFFLETVGLLHKRVLLRSEYGVVLGEAQLVSKGRTGQLVLDARKYFFRWTNNTLALLNRNHALLFEAAADCREDTDGMERYAFVFSTAWLAQGGSVAAASASAVSVA